MAPTKQLPAVPAFEIRRSGIQGRGGFATRRIKKGERIGEYLGERISQGEADRRYDDDAMARHHTFLFAITSRTVLDAAVGGNDTRFINHSCAPNCDAVIERGRVFIDACKPIAAGAELFYDYSYEREPDAAPDVESQYPCRCGAPRCRGTILMPPPRRRKRRSASRRSASRRSSKRSSKKAARKGSRPTKRPSKRSSKRSSERPSKRPTKRPTQRQTSRTPSRVVGASKGSVSKTPRSTRSAARR
jgi:hypothetical protein